VIKADDKLLLIGREEKILGLKEMGLEIHPVHHNGHLTYQGIKVAEVLLTPHASVQGQTLKEIDFRKKYGLTVVALRRLNRSYRTDVGEFPLTFGDSMLVDLLKRILLKKTLRAGLVCLIKPRL